MNTINSHSNNEEIVTLDDYVRRSEVLRNMNSSFKFDYELNDKTAKAKLLKAAKRSPMEVEENSTSLNLVFSAGAWHHIDQPSVRYWNANEEKLAK